MGRSVMTARDAVAVAYDHFDDESDDWEFYADGLAIQAQELWPSMFEPVSDWLEDEVRIIAENGLARVTLSEYCGSVAICLVPRDDVSDGAGYESDALSTNWCKQVAPRFLREFGTLEKIGTASNGVSFYRNKSA